MNIFLKPMEEILKSTQEKGKITSTQELADFFLKKVNETEDMTQKHRADMDARIMAKLKAGKKLTPEELNYLRRTNSMMYAQALRIQHMAEAEKKKEGNNENAFSGGKEEKEKIDLKNWSPLQEVFDQMPTFSAGA